MPRPPVLWKSVKQDYRRPFAGQRNVQLDVLGLDLLVADPDPIHLGHQLDRGRVSAA